MNRTGLACLAALLAISLGACASNEPEPGTVRDEAMRAGLAPEQLRPADAGLFPRHGLQRRAGRATAARSRRRSPAGTCGWSGRGGNDRLWDRLTIDSLGTFDLLKTISSHPKAPGDSTYGAGYGRHNRWEYLGLVNEPCFKEADGTGSEPLWSLARRPRSSHVHRIRLPTRRNIRGSRSARAAQTVAVGSYYGEPTGIVGLRLFPNPDFDERARKRWDADRFYNDPTYYFDRNLVRPYRVGDVVRLLPRRPEPDQAAGGSRESEVGEPELERRRAVLLVGPHLRLARPEEREQPFLSGAPCLATGHARHVARLDRQHQQPADDERGLLPGAAHGAGEEMGQGNASPAAD